LTGETGAGKSILVDALGLLLGDRASSDSIRSGEELAVVEACIESTEAAAFLEGRGIATEDAEVVLRREVHAAGKSRAIVNGALVPVGLLKDLAPLIAAIHGQHEQRDLLDPESHLVLLDRHAGLDQLRGAIAETFNALRETQSAIRRLEDDAREAERLRDSLDFQAAEIEGARLAPGEEDQLKRDKALHGSAARVLALATEAYRLLYDDESAALSQLGQAYRKLEELAALDPRLVPFLEGRGEVTARVEDTALFLRDYRQRIESSPARLDEIESRLALIERLKRKYGASEVEVLAFGARCRARLAAFVSLDEERRRLEAERSGLCKRYLDAAQELSRKRRLSSSDLAARVEAELASLAMEKARFRVSFSPEDPQAVTEGDWSEKGLETAEFLLAANPGEELRPLTRVASGGELSRILLALKSVAHLDAPGKTLVFDEVDAGIGGGVAEVLGRKLKSLARHHQVFCVTHLPQIACMADHHHVVRKRVEQGRTVTEVTSLEGSERVEEVARMLGGETITDTARRHARELVEQGRPRA
jgi:DNA repair protein RecN (Recombination protein N)